MSRDHGRVRTRARSRSGAPATLVSTRESSPARGGQSCARALRQFPVGLPELGLVASCLLEVEAEDLVHLDEIRAALVQPVGEALVELCADGLGETVVGGIADEQVPEAKRIVTRQLRAVGPDQLLANESRQSRDDRPVLGERLHRATVEDLALDGAALEHRALRLLQLVEARGQQGLEVRRHEDIRTGVCGHRRHLRQEERIAAGRMSDPGAQLGG